MHENTTHGRRQQIENLIAALGKQVGIPELSLEKGHACTLSVDDVIVTLRFDESRDDLALFTILQRVSEPLGVPGMLLMNELNAILFQREHACFSYNRETLDITQSFRIDAAQLTQDRLLRWIERSIATIERSRQAIADMLSAEPETLHDPGEDVAFFRA